MHLGAARLSGVVEYARPAQLVAGVAALPLTHHHNPYQSSWVKIGNRVLPPLIAPCTVTTTLLRIQDRLRDPKVAVWAHNSHVGDTTATTRGGTGFERNETWNLGQMVRATFGVAKTWIIGQYTHRGVVTAAPDWGRPHADVPLRPALPDSYEAGIHALFERAGVGPGELWAFQTAPFLSAAMSDASEPPPPAEAAAVAGLPPPAIAAGLRALLSGPSRLQRWVGVSYKPETELQSQCVALGRGA